MSSLARNVKLASEEHMHMPLGETRQNLGLKGFSFARYSDIKLNV